MSEHEELEWSCQFPKFLENRHLDLVFQEDQAQLIQIHGEYTIAVLEKRINHANFYIICEIYINVWFSLYR